MHRLRRDVYPLGCCRSLESSNTDGDLPLIVNSQLDTSMPYNMDVKRYSTHKGFESKKS